jgi:hypothetical protein
VSARRAVICLGLALIAASCVDALAQTPTPSPTTKASPSPPSYERKGRRDPFQPLETSQGVASTVASARLRGIIRGASTRALLETPDGIGYIMKPGDMLGDARLLDIGPDSVVFRVPPKRGSTTDLFVLRLSSN